MTTEQFAEFMPQVVKGVRLLSMIAVGIFFGVGAVLYIVFRRR